MKGSTRQIPGASFIWSCFVQNRAFILCPLKCDFRPLDIAWQPCVRLPRNIATRSRFYSRRSANTYPSLESDHKNDPYHGKTGQHALTSNKIFFSKSPVFAVHRGIVRHLPAEHKIQSLPVRIPPSPPEITTSSDVVIFFAMCDTIRSLKHVLTLPSPGERRNGCPKYIGRPPDQPKAALGLEIPESGAGHRPANPEKKDTLFSVSFFWEWTVKIDIS